MDNALLNMSGNFPADKTEEQITSALSHAHVYLTESDDERHNNYAAANKLYKSCDGRGSSSSISSITVSVLATSDVFFC